MRDRRHPEALLSAFLDDELDEAASLRVARHVSSCPPCLAELDELRAARAALRDMPEPPSPPDAVFAAVPEAARDDDRRAARRRAVGAALGGILGVLALAFVVGEEPPGDVVPPVDLVVVDHVARTGAGPVIQPVDFGR